MRLTVIVPAFRNSGKIEENLKRLDGFEVILAADLPDEKLREIIRKEDLKATVSDRRRGKWKALNDAMEIASGEYILFLDSDTVLLDPGDMKKYDGAEVVKEVCGNSFLEKLVRIDYFNMYLISLLASRLGTCLGFNGAAFWIRRDVLKKLGGFRRRINEDTDLGVRFGIYGYRYGVCGRAVTDSPKTIREWLAQRERWALGGAEILMENLWSIIRKPVMWIPSLFIMFPSIIGLFINLILPDSFFLKSLYFFIAVAGLISGKAVAIVMYLVYGYHLLRNITAGMITFGIWAAIMAFLSKITKYSIDLRYLPLYYFIYSPLWMFVAVIALAKYILYRLLGKKVRIENWKV